MVMAVGRGDELRCQLVGFGGREVVEHLWAAGYFAEDGGLQIPYLPSVGFAGATSRAATSRASCT